MKEIIWHHLTIEKVLSSLKTKESGLIQEEAEIRLKKFGKNKLIERKAISGWRILINQVKSPLVYILLFADFISIYLFHWVDFAFISAVIIINTAIGFVQEKKANTALDKLKRLLVYKAKVLRDHQEIQINSTNLVPGDIVFIEAGDRVPADCRIISSLNLKTIEASLTGESNPSEKFIEKLDKGTVLAERQNMIYLGTTVSTGKATAVVCATGKHTELGKIALLIHKTEKDKTPLQIQLLNFSKILSAAFVSLAFLIVVIGLLQGRPLIVLQGSTEAGLLFTAVAVAVAAIPEGLLVAVTIILTIGMRVILKRGALVRKLIATETLGSTSIICTDKTGTLTEGKMHLMRISNEDEKIDITRSMPDNTHETTVLLLKSAVICNNAVITNPNDDIRKWKFIGDQTEAAILLAGVRFGLHKDDLEKQEKRIDEIPFDSSIKYMATLNKKSKTVQTVYLKGAPETVLNHSKFILHNKKITKLTDEKIKKIRARYELMSKKSLRVLGVAYKVYTKVDNIEDAVSDLVFIGLLGFKDPLRPETKNAYKLTKRAGIRTIMITGDHKFTAKAIAADMGMKVKEENIIDGSKLDNISDEELRKIIKNVDIFSRVTPKHKIRIVDAWQAKGAVVAMTGDGVNDAPALKSANIGIALNSGTDVAKETADMILVDNNFQTIVAAVKQGRIIFENIQKVVLYLLADSFSEIILIVGALLLFMPLPILPAQILWINLVNDSFIALALTAEKGESGIMRDKPRKINMPVLNAELKTMIFLIGIIVNIALFILYFILLRENLNIDYIRTVIFTVLALDSLFYSFSCRSLRHSLFTKGFFSNKYLVGAFFLGLFLQILAIYEPHLQRLFRTVPLGIADWILVVFFSIFGILAIEFTKHHFIIKRKLNLKQRQI